MNRHAIKWGTLTIVLALVAPTALADVTSPSIKDRGKKYTTEKPNTALYGTGNSGRLVEASELRIAVDDLLAAGEWQKALPLARKAVQFDPGDPAGHIFLARALTLKFYQTKGQPDEKILGECMREWEMIRRHDADPTEQWEAGNHVKQLKKIARAIEKDRIQREREKEAEAAEKAEIAAKKDAAKPKTAEAADTAPKSARASVAAKLRDAEAPEEEAALSKEAKEDASTARQTVKSGEKLVEKKRRWGIF